ncbi:MAG TPA: hypothetical protein VG324_17485, partial [Blastocatellia bacterium]|nr:hypothetical protein [Blastocatellia bacterium]
MSRFLRTRLLLPAAALILTATAAADIFGQSSGMAADVSNSTSPNNVASSNLTPRGVVAPKSTVGNFPVIVPSGLNGDTETNKATNKTTDKTTDQAANKSGPGENVASSDSATPPSPPTPSPQGGISQFSGRTFSRERNAPQQ